MKKEQILEKYNNVVDWVYTTCEDNVTASFVNEWLDYEVVKSVKDALQNVDDQEDYADIVDLFEALGYSEKQKLDAIYQNCNVEFVDGVFYQTNEVFGMELGEVEVQPEDETIKAYLALSDEDREWVDRNCEGCIANGGWLYVNMSYQRWASILDVEGLIESLQAIKNEKNIINASI